jgi:hypothetical protein
MQQSAPRQLILLRYGGWLSVSAVILFSQCGWPGSSIGLWSAIVIGSLVGGGLLAWLQSRSGFGRR